MPFTPSAISLLPRKLHFNTRAPCLTHSHLRWLRSEAAPSCPSSLGGQGTACRGVKGMQAPLGMMLPLSQKCSGLGGGREHPTSKLSTPQRSPWTPGPKCHWGASRGASSSSLHSAADVHELLTPLPAGEGRTSSRGSPGVQLTPQPWTCSDKQSFWDPGPT